ncbi:hypothetical protein HanXRQr2_Chr11g0512411 [Helianthus annuus]|uniref:Uncharacterized protein n=1 Tax=Helianthus annuus TaxID=4232 RepID=A0A9K3N298_HELAN|nr:hypothetical protein HanXRQr2_Chr11g0512411 [Helianthus annuus]KAJ0876897.1 hypothetical protein HanPSC8_Chr11g0493721 [Helianthus annuus]
MYNFCFVTCIDGNSRRLLKNLKGFEAAVVKLIAIGIGEPKKARILAERTG